MVAVVVSVVFWIGAVLPAASVTLEATEVAGAAVVAVVVLAADGPTREALLNGKAQ